MTFSGIVTALREVQFLNALSPILVTFFPITIFSREPSPLNAPSPITVTVSGIAIDESSIQLQKA